MRGIGTYALLSELAGTLVLSVPQQLNDAALIGGKTDDLTSDVPDELSAAGRLALGTADLVLGGVEGSGFLLSELLVNLVQIIHLQPCSSRRALLFECVDSIRLQG